VIFTIFHLFGIVEFKNGGTGGGAGLLPLEENSKTTTAHIIAIIKQKYNYPLLLF